MTLPEREGPLSEEELQRIRERAAAATPGPWFWTKCDQMFAAGSVLNPEYDYDMTWQANGPHVPPTRIIETDSGFYPPRENDRAFIAYARSDVPALLAEIDRLRAIAGSAVPPGRE